ncbi:hypothetical protein KHP62_16845 [Rhodobacteraceae bacterium NNCM2]|nr:hypothetical protein [Coraliihabitans acroporae]
MAHADLLSERAEVSRNPCLSCMSAVSGIFKGVFKPRGQNPGAMRRSGRRGAVSAAPRRVSMRQAINRNYATLKMFEILLQANSLY